MKKEDLVKKKSVAFDLDTYARLSAFAANLRAANPGGGFVSMAAAVAVLLNSYGKKATGWAGTDPDVFLRENGFRGDLEVEKVPQ